MKLWMESKFVFVERQGKLTKEFVKTGLEDGNFIELIGKITNGDKIVKKADTRIPKEWRLLIRIKIDHLNKSYSLNNIDFPILHDINLTIEKGEFVSIMGPSGSGKSTLMNIIGCLDQQTSGIYTLNGKDVVDMDNNEKSTLRNSTIGFVFQHFNLLPKLSALDNVELPLIYAKEKKIQRKQRAKTLLSKVGLESQIHHKPNELSGGQKQRVSIARALANEPDIILADEPTGALDSKSGAQIMEIFKLLNREGITIIMITHEQEIAFHSKRQVILNDGKIVSDKRMN